jgi:hypothetical protein
MPARSAFDYAIVRVMPRIERGEYVNVGVILFCRERAFLGARTHLSARRLLALEPDLDPALLAEIAEQVANIPRIAAGDPDGGAIATLSQPERYHWLVAPRSTVVQVSEAHAGLSDNPDAVLDHLFATLVRMPEKQAKDSSKTRGTVRLSRASYETALAALERSLMAEGSAAREDVAAALQALTLTSETDAKRG